MQSLIKCALLLLLLVSCGGKDSRYRDNAMLEKPPILAIERHGDEQAVAPDDSVIPKKTDETGLGDAVVMKEKKPLHLIIKKPVNDAWRLLGLALKQGQIHITDHEQDKGLYYVYFKPKNLLENAASLFSKDKGDEHHDANIVLTVTAQDSDTKVVATLINPPSSDDDDNLNSDLDAFLWQLYDVLHDDLKEE